MEIKTKFSVNQPATIKNNSVEVIINKIETYTEENIDHGPLETSIFYYCVELYGMCSFCFKESDNELLPIKTNKPESTDFISYIIDGNLIYEYGDYTITKSRHFKNKWDVNGPLTTITNLSFDDVFKALIALDLTLKSLTMSIDNETVINNGKMKDGVKLDVTKEKNDIESYNFRVIVAKQSKLT